MTKDVFKFSVDLTVKRSVLVRIFFLLILSELLINFPVFAQMSPCSIRLTVSVTPARCQADGGIRCVLSDTAGSRLEQIRYYYIPNNGIDSITETSLSEIHQLRSGTYEVKVTALCHTNLGGSNTYIIVKDSVTNVVVESTYEIPSNGIPLNIFSHENRYGIVPSMACTPTGRLQICIEKGTFPYYVDVLKVNGTDTVFWKTQMFDTNMYAQNNPMLYDYKCYYTIDSLEVGQYVFRCHDGCGYYMPALAAEIPRILYHWDQEYHVMFHSTEVTDSYNVLRFAEISKPLPYFGSVGVNDDYYHSMGIIPNYLEYRFINPTLCQDKDTSEWRIMPVRTDPNLISVYNDTLSALSDYSEIWNKTVILQLRSYPCHDTVMSFPFVVFPQGNQEDEFLQSLDSSFSQASYYDRCGYHTEYIYSRSKRNGIRIYHAVRSEWYNYDHYSFLYPGLPNSIGKLYHNYITLPIHYKLTDLTENVLAKFDTLKQNSYNWDLSVTFEDELIGDSLLIEVMDAHNSPLYSQSFRYDTVVQIQDVPSILKKYEWKTYAMQTNQYCPEDMKHVVLYQRNGTYKGVTINGHVEYTSEGDTIRLIVSPDDNKYCYMAIGLAKGWKVSRMRPDNLAIIEYTTFRDVNSQDCPCIWMRDVNLPAGRYVWEISPRCGNGKDTVVYDLKLKTIPRIAENPKYQFFTKCTELDVVPLSGSFAIGDSLVSTQFQMTLNNQLCYQNNFVGSTLTAGVPGTYTLSMIYKDNLQLWEVNSNPCFRKDTVIVWGGGNIVFDYLYSYVCGVDDSVGFVRAHGKNGPLPYTYTLFDAPGGKGNVIAHNQTGEFYNVPLHFAQSMSVDMVDSCGAHFLTDFKVSDMEHIRKCWAENNVNSVSVCEGAECHLYGLSLGNVTYHWTGPNGFYRDTQNPVLPIERNSNAAGTYYVAVEGSGCLSMWDSVAIKVLAAPSVTIERDTSLCPGQVMQVVTTAHGYGNISYTLRQRDFADTASFSFINRVDNQIDTTNKAIFRNNTRFFVDYIKDERCAFHLPEDTVRVTLKEHNTATGICARKDTVCAGRTAVLTANANTSVPYEVRWYRDFAQTYRLKSDTVRQVGDVSSFQIPELYRDTDLYVQAVTVEGCPYVFGANYSQIRMFQGSLTIRFGEDAAFYDSGGQWDKYSNWENMKMTVYSQDSISPVTLHVQDFMCQCALYQERWDALYVFDGPTAEGSPSLTLKGAYHNGEIPDFTSTHGSMTFWFVSNHNQEYEKFANSYKGWKCTLSTHALPKVATAVVKPSLSVTVMVDSVSNSDTVRAFAFGGSQHYRYQWEQSSDSLNWRALRAVDTLLAVDSLEITTYFKVTVADDSVELCDAVAIVKIPVVIKIDTVYAFADSSICETDLPIVWNGLHFDKADTLDVVLPTVNGGDSILTMRLHLLLTSDTTLTQTINESDLPIVWNGLWFEVADTLTTSFFNQAGCDSLITMILNVKPLPPCPAAVDYDGNVYPSVRIDRYCWTRENLRSFHYSDGRSISDVMEYVSVLYPNVTENVSVFGRLYSWIAAVDSAQGLLVNAQGHIQGICPHGWYLPQSVQYLELSTHGTLALRVPDYWINGTGGNNSTDFSALPAGFYNGNTNRYENLMGETRFWSTNNAANTIISSCINFHFPCSEIKITTTQGVYGYSIRCILEE